MRATDWSDRTTDAEAFSRASGRRYYNSIRKFNAQLRLADVVKLLKKYGMGHGAQTAIAKELGVSRSTICRDMATILEESYSHYDCRRCKLLGR